VLSPLDLRQWLPQISWVICGGESGSADRIRYMDPDWARSLRDQCAACGVRFLMKQMTGGEKVPIPPDLKIEQYPDA
jgi:protein gp37